MVAKTTNETETALFFDSIKYTQKLSDVIKLIIPLNPFMFVNNWLMFNNFHLIIISVNNISRLSA